MRIALASLAFLLASGCGDPRPAEVDRIEIRRSGWSAVDIALDRAGSGRFRLGEPPPGGKSGYFSVTPEQFARLRERLEPFRRQSVPLSEESIRRFIDEGCPEGVPFVTDAGAVYIRWIGPGSDRHFLADLGCDHERNARRNRELLDAVRRLPVPLGE
jgi:hypothetical protein